jgi:tetratricopeptide (TPR) repeat protein
VAAWLHKALETYRIPRKLVGALTPLGPVPSRLTPIFRDRDELPASGNLGGELTAALTSSRFLVVLCSPSSAHSQWVGEEVLAFKRLYGEDRILAMVVAGRPGASAIPGEEALECFPPAMRFRLDADGRLSKELAHPIAADMRRDKDGRQLAKLKLVAGLTGVRLDDLVQREAQRRARSLAAIAGGSFAGMVLAGGLALYANERRIEADKQRRIAETETAAARATSDYLIGTYKLINPATENPRSISALALLSRGADRARTELADQPEIHARILQALGQAYINLGLSKELVDEVSQSMPAILRAGPAGAAALIQMAGAYSNLGKLDEAMRAADEAGRLLGPRGGADPALRADVDAMKGSILYSRGDLLRGLGNIDAALALYRAAIDPPPAKLAWALHERGLILSDQGRYAAAAAALNESMSLYRRVFGDRHVATAGAWYAMALNDQAAGHLNLAAKRIESALAIQRVVLDGDNPILADSYSAQGTILQGQGKLDAAAAALSKAVSIYRRSFRHPHYQTGIALVYLAQVESDRGRSALALAELDEAKRDYDASYGKVSPNQGDLLVYRAKVLDKAGRRTEALGDCAAGMKILDETLGADASYTRSDAAICAKL